MADGTHNRVSSGKVACLIGAFLLMVAPIFGSICASNDCASQNPKVAPPCSGMDMPKHVATAVWANSSGSCCHMTQIPPATVGQTGETQKVKGAVSAFVVPGSLSAEIVPTFRLGSNHVDSSPPHDVQSLFCTLLI